MEWRTFSSSLASAMAYVWNVPTYVRWCFLLGVVSSIWLRIALLSVSNSEYDVHDDLVFNSIATQQIVQLPHMIFDESNEFKSQGTLETSSSTYVNRLLVDPSIETVHIEVEWNDGLPLQIVAAHRGSMVYGKIDRSRKTSQIGSWSRLSH